MAVVGAMGASVPLESAYSLIVCDLSKVKILYFNSARCMSQIALSLLTALKEAGGTAGRRRSSKRGNTSKPKLRP
jgi:hypothetical protein